MKTILVIYTNHRVPTSTIGNRKKYAFNTSDEVKVGQGVATDSYDTPLQVVKVLDEAFKYYNEATGELSNEFTSTKQWEIKELKIREDNNTAVYGSIIVPKDDK